MHSYSLDTTVRRNAYVIMAVIALSIPAIFEGARTLLGLPDNWGFPLAFGTLYGGLHMLYDHYLWRKCAPFIGVPDLNGKWIAHGISSYKNPDTGENYKFDMNITIRQTFSHMEVFTETKDSTSRSTMASICTKHAVPLFRYTFENAPKSMADLEMQRHPGMIELRINDSSHLTGDYFSGKHRLRYGELSIEKE